MKLLPSAPIHCIKVYTVDGSEIGIRIREARLRRGWSLRQLKEKSGVSHGYISQLERGDVPKPGIDRVVKLYDALGLDVRELGADREASEADELAQGLEGVDVNLLAIKELDREEFLLIARQLAERREKLEREWREMHNAQRRRSKAAKQAREAATKKEPT